ncbi:recombinase [Synergistales bacterium]|nr:recombinase [Synergistales bacterium]
MQIKITQSVVQNVEPQKKTLKVYDTLLKGFVLFVRPTGKKTWYVDYRKSDGKRTNYLIGHANLFTVIDARERAREFLSTVARGEDPTVQNDILTFGKFLSDIYEPWVVENRRTGKSTVYMLTSSFKFLADTPLDQISIAQIEQWRGKEKRKGLKASTTNRRVTALNAAINWATRRSIIAANPIIKLERLSEEDSVSKVRYLSKDERERLMAALDAREKEIRQGRDNHNEWLKARDLNPVPSIGENDFVDHLKPIILLSLSTGIRRNSVLSLEWRDVNFADKMIMVRAATSKTSKQYYVPMNDLAFETLSIWYNQSKKTSPGNLVFPSPQTGKKMDNCNTAWEHLLKRAEIEDFRWHDMRHDFASQLVMAGVDLNTVRELLGHADLQMTLRYAHLAPENKLQAVKVLDQLRSAS